MKQIFFITVLILFSGYCHSQNTPGDSIARYPINMTVDEFNKRTSIKDKLVLVNFEADWCIMCKKQKPILNEIIAEKKNLEVIIIDMEQNPLIAEYFNVDGLPINLIYKNGTLAWDRAGFRTKNELLKQINVFE
jgi:thioredoxin 1